MTQSHIHLAAILWLSGADTSDIADRLNLYPSAIYNFIDAIKAEAAILRGKAA